jgi:hypothetical protein
MIRFRASSARAEIPSLFIAAILMLVAAAQDLKESTFRRVDSPFLPNAYWVHPTVMSGGKPEGKPAFEELSRQGIRTIISVDGIKPDVDAAQQSGLRYIHLPHGYDGISDERILEIAKAVRDLPGPVYIHCHHGRHRSPAAAAAVCIALGKISPTTGLELLRTAGTNIGFRGLFQAVERTKPVTAETLEQLQVDFVPVAELPPMVDAMVAMDAILDRLKELQGEGWHTPWDDARSNALMLKEHYMELHRSESEKGQESDFLAWLLQGRDLANQLEVQLNASLPAASEERDAFTKELNGSVKKLSQNCVQCHQQYRDNR